MWHFFLECVSNGNIAETGLLRPSYEAFWQKKSENFERWKNRKILLGKSVFFEKKRFHFFEAGRLVNYQPSAAIVQET